MTIRGIISGRKVSSPAPQITSSKTLPDALEDPHTTLMRCGVPFRFLFNFYISLHFLPFRCCSERSDCSVELPWNPLTKKSEIQSCTGKKTRACEMLSSCFSLAPQPLYWAHSGRSVQCPQLDCLAIGQGEMFHGEGSTLFSPSKLGSWSQDNYFGRLNLGICGFKRSMTHWQTKRGTSACMTKKGCPERTL